jgi:hypothetical protein
MLKGMMALTFTKQISKATNTFKKAVSKRAHLR